MRSSSTIIIRREAPSMQAPRSRSQSRRSTSSCKRVSRHGRRQSPGELKGRSFPSPTIANPGLRIRRQVQFAPRKRNRSVRHNHRHSGVRCHRLVDDVVYERRHRNVFHFIYSADGSGGGRNDFMERYNPFLAYAARCTSSFPFAFEPMRLCDIDDILDGFPYYSGKVCKSDSDRWQRFFQDYLNPTGVRAIPFPQRSFGDGGYLQQPFTTQRTPVAHKRRVPLIGNLIYIERRRESRRRRRASPEAGLSRECDGRSPDSSRDEPSDKT